MDATILAAPRSTKNASGQRNPAMGTTQKSGQWHFGLKAHIGVDAKSGLMHHVRTTPANVHDTSVLTELLHGGEEVLVTDSAYADMMLKARCRQAGLRYPIIDKGGVT